MTTEAGLPTGRDGERETLNETIPVPRHPRAA
jgi:hypothetical protein